MGRLGQILGNISDLITFKKVKKARRRQTMGMAMGALWSASVVYALYQPENESWICRGPVTSGHQEISCNSCHQPAQGTARQQLQTKANFMLGLRASDADFGLLKVDNNQCLDCHSRPDDQHSVFRFKESRFSEVREVLDATQCGSCHKQHKGTVVALPDTEFCTNCHQDLKIKEDPLEIPHQELIGKAMWVTCMQCHDYHGNHEMKLATSLKDTIPVQKILNYFDKGPDPYSSVKRSKAKTNVEK
jgi:hypothetical protein